MPKLGYKQTKEHRDKNLGKKRSMEFCEKLRQIRKLDGAIPPSRKGVILSDEHRKKISMSNSGKKRTDEQRLKLSIAKMGNKSNLWMGGISSLQQVIRSSHKYRLWREQIFARDKYTCVVCKTSGGVLQADHMVSFSSLIKSNNLKSSDDALDCCDLWNLNNGRTLCLTCHEKTDSYPKNLVRRAKSWKSKL